MTALAIVAAAVALVLGVRLAYHVLHLRALRAWLRQPLLDTLPRGRGVWEDLLAEVHRYLKRRDAEEMRLAHALERFRDASRALPDGIVILDREHRIEWANPTAARHFGIDARRDLGQPVMNMIRHPDFVAFLRGGDFRDVLRLRTAREATLEVRVIEFGEEQKLLSSRDVTAEERLDTMRRDFVANVSHELKTPVTVLSGFVETLADETFDIPAAQRRRFLALMAEQASRMQRLIEDLLELSALESNTAAEDEQPIDLRPFIERLADEARALSSGRHRIEASLDADCRLLGSARELHSAFSNLVSNAVRYTPEGGTVRVAWRAEADGGATFSVSDTGIGIEARHIPRLTERFYRVDSGRSRDTGGTGLGLAIVKHALTRHQAMLRIASEPGRGSTFSAYFSHERILPGAARAAA